MPIRTADKRGHRILNGRDPSEMDGTRPALSVFFSYSREDQVKAKAIIELIEAGGFPVWWDGLIKGGSRYAHITEEALEKANAVVVLWSKASVASHWVHDEAARGRDRRVLVPLSLDGTPPPLGFGQFQAIDLSHSHLKLNDIEVQRMLQAIEGLHGAQTADIIPRPVSRQMALNRRNALIAGGAMAAMAGGFAAWQTGILAGGKANANRVAILPFNNESDDTAFDYLADGLSTEIRSTLSQNGALQVIGQVSSETFVRGKQDILSFAKKLQAALLIDGAVRVEKGVIRITIDLIDGKTGVNRPSRTFEKPLDDVLAVQREIAGAIAAELATELGGGGAAVGGTSNVVAYDHYLRGKDLYSHASNEAEEREAVVQFEAAVATDPRFAAAHAGRARALASVAGQYGSASEIKNYYEAAIASARRAVDLAPRLADAHSALALILFQGVLDIKAARAPFDLSYRLGEGEAPVLARFAAYCAATGRDSDAMTAISRSILLDPLNALIRRIAGTVHFAARRYPEAIQAVRETIRLTPDLADTRSHIGMALLAQSKNREALAEFETETHKWSRLAGVAIAQHRLGNIAASKTAYEELVKDTETVSLYQQGQILAQWGQYDDAIQTLAKARVLRDGGMTALGYDPMLDPLRNQPDFIRLLKAIGFG